MATLTGQSIASSYEQLLHIDNDGGGNGTTHVSVKDGDNGTTFSFTIATDALMMTSTNRLEFGDTGTYINQSSDGVLNITSDTEVEINATTIDINGAVAMDGAITGGTNITISGELDAATLDISGNADIDGTLEADAYTVDGTALSTYIRDTVGTNMLSSNTESGITVTYDTSNDNIDFSVDAAQTGITSLLATDIKIGEDDQTKIDFETADTINFYAGNENQLVLTNGYLTPSSNAIVDLGTDALEFKDLYIDGTAYLDTVDIDAGAIDGTTIGANSAAAGTFTTLNTSGTTTLGDASGDTLTINAATINPANIATGTDNTVVVYNGSTLVTDEIDSRVWGSTLVDTDASGANNELATWSDANTIIGEGNLTFDGTDLLIAGGGKAAFRDNGGEYIYSVSDGTLGIAAGTEIDLTATNIDINGAVDISGNLVVGGDFTVNGTTTTINSTVMQVDDKMIELAHSPSGSEGADAAVDGGGITLKSSDSDKTILWTNSTDQWHYNQGINITSGNLVVADNIDLEGDIDVNGTANLDAVDIDGAVDMASTLAVGDDVSITSATGDKPVLTLKNTNADNSASILKFIKDSSSPADGDQLGHIHFIGDDDGGSAVQYALIRGVSTDVTNDDKGGEIDFVTYSANSYQYMTFQEGKLGVGTEAPERILHTKGAAEVQALFENPSTSSSQFAYVDIESNAGSSGEAILRLKTPDGTSYINSKGSATTMTFSSGNVGINVTNPASILEIRQDVPNIRIDSYNTTAGNASDIQLRRSNHGTLGTHTAVDADDALGKISFIGSDSNSFEVGAKIQGTAAETWVNGAEYGTYLTFHTTDIGTATLDERMRITDAGLVGIGTSSPSKQLTVAGGSALFSRADSTPSLATAPNVNISDVIVGSSDTANTGITILSTNQGAVAFGDAGAVQQGQLSFQHSTNTLQLSTDDVVRFALDANSRISLSNNDNNSNNTVFGYTAFNAGSDNGSDYNTIIGHNSAGTGSVSGATYNVGLGYNSLTDLTSADYNVALGSNAASNITTGGSNVAIGQGALFTPTTAASNVVIGQEAMADIQAGQAITGCVAVGFEAIKGAGGTTTGIDGSVAVGNQALKALTTGARNLAIGYQAADSLTVGDDNIAIGHNAFGSATTTDGIDANIAIGTYALDGTSGQVVSSVVAIGYAAMTGACENEVAGSIAIGRAALGAVTTGSANLAIGYRAGEALTASSENTVIGYEAFDAATTGMNNNMAIGKASFGNANHTGFDRNMAIGDYAGDGAGAYAHVDNVYIGMDAGGGTHGAIVSRNIAIGRNAFSGSNDGGGANVAIGYAALSGSMTSAADNNVAIGQNAGENVTSAAESVFVGADSGDEITSGTKNTALGANALSTATTALYNTAVGFNAMSDVQAGQAVDGCVAIGYEAMKGSGSTTTGANYSIAIGKTALKSITEGERNIAIGFETLISPTTGSDDCIAIGYQSQGGNQTTAVNNSNVSIGNYTMDANMTGAVNNTAVGHYSGSAITSGDFNVLLGSASGQILTTGSQNTLCGFAAGDAATTTSYLTCVGYNAGTAINSTDADATTAIGKSSLAALTEGVGSTALGNNSSLSVTTGDYNTSLGFNAGKFNATGSNNTFVGNSAGLGVSSNNHSNNTGVGKDSLLAITDGADNVAVGYNSLVAITSGGRNTAVGKSAGAAMVGNSYNTLVGYNAFATANAGEENNVVVGYGAGAAIDDGSSDYNVLIGSSAGNGGAAAIAKCVVVGALAMDDTGASAQTGTVAIGYQALTAANSVDTQGSVAIGYQVGAKITEGVANVLIGQNVGYQGTYGLTTGDHNTAIGHMAFGGNAGADGGTMHNNVCVGFRSGYVMQGASSDNVLMGSYSGDKITTGTKNTCIGKYADTDDATATNQTVIGFEAEGVADNSVTLGDSNVTAVYMAEDSGAKVYCGEMQMANTSLDTGASTWYGQHNQHTKTAGATTNSHDITGFRETMYFNDGDTYFAALAGLKVYTNSQASAGESESIYGGYFNTAMGGSTDVGNMYGQYNLVDIDAGTVDANVYGQYTSVDIDGGTLSGDIYGHSIIMDTPNPSGTQEAIYISMNANADRFLRCYDADNSTARVLISAAGQIDAEGSINASQSLDYAEYFESKDGKVIASGTSVKLDGDKIVVCSEGDTPLGAIRPKSAQCIVGGSHVFHWAEKYMKDDYGADIWEEHTLTKWSVEVDFDEYIKRGKSEEEQLQYFKVEGSREVLYKEGDELPEGKEVGDVKEAAVADTYFREHSYHSDRIPDSLTAPDDAEVIDAGKRQKLNPDYDDSKEYKSREERDEWHIVGLLGQIPITKGQPTGNWIKMKDVSDTVEMYFVK